MKAFSGLFAIMLMANGLLAQDVATIITAKCQPCHRTGMSAPFAINTANDLLKRKDMVRLVVERGIMPPWQADSAGLQFKHSRALSTTERFELLEWLEEQKVNIRFPLARRSSHSSLGRSDAVTIALPGRMRVPASASDTTIEFSIPFRFDRSQNAVSLSFRSSEWKYIHHVNIFVCDSLRMTIGGDMMAGSVFVHGWAPGNTDFRFSEGVGFILPKAGVVRGDIHFSAKPEPSAPQIFFELGLSPMPVMREIKPVVFLESQPKVLDNDSIFIPAGSKKRLRAKYSVKSDYTLVCLSPHMHVFGRRFKAYLINGNDTTLLISIPDWDPAWQDFYLLDRPLHLPKGSVIEIEGEFDNTSENPRQPFNPPVPIGNGWKITDEMFVMFMFGTDYSEGDEMRKFVE